MSPEWIIGVLVTVILGLVGIIYGLLRSEDKRLANAGRNLVPSIVMVLASRGIKVPKKDE